MQTTHYLLNSFIFYNKEGVSLPINFFNRSHKDFANDELFKDVNGYFDCKKFELAFRDEDFYVNVCPDC